MRQSVDCRVLFSPRQPSRSSRQNDPKFSIKNDLINFQGRKFKSRILVSYEHLWIFAQNDCSLVQFTPELRNTTLHNTGTGGAALYNPDRLQCVFKMFKSDTKKQRFWDSNSKLLSKKWGFHFLYSITCVCNHQHAAWGWWDCRLHISLQHQQSAAVRRLVSATTREGGGGGTALAIS